MGVEAQRYHGWWIFAIPQEGCWIPECHRSGGREVCTGGVSYRSPLEAINAAKFIVDYAIPRSMLAYALDDWLEAGKINDQEYEKLMQSIYRDT